MQVIHPICAGMDVHKQDVKVCLVWRDADDQRQQEIRTYATTTGALLQLSDWLAQSRCPIVAMESTGVYWKPIYNLLEDAFTVWLVNPSHLKYVEGRKTDPRDAAWLAELLEHGLLQPSFIPEQEIRDLREVTRYRRKLVQEKASQHNRIQKILEDANIKLASVVSDITGVSARAMLAALVAGDKTPAEMAELARARLRNKRTELTAALEGRFRSHHARLLGLMLEHLDELDQSIADCDTLVEELLRPFQPQVERLRTIPGIERRAAEELLAEVGVDMSAFPSHKHLCSWAGLCPGDHESGGKRKSGRMRHGNRYLRSILSQCAHAVGRSKKTYLGARYGRLAKRKGKPRAAMAIAHDILEAAYFILRDDVEFVELGPDFFDRLQRDYQIRYHTRRLRELGIEVALPQAVAA
jgi:transposase